MAADTPAALIARLPDRTISARTTLDDSVLRSFPGVLGFERDGDRVRVATAAPEAMLRLWLTADPAVADLRVDGAGLEDALLALTDGAGAEVAA